VVSEEQNINLLNRMQKPGQYKEISGGQSAKALNRPAESFLSFFDFILFSIICMPYRTYAITRTRHLRLCIKNRRAIQKDLYNSFSTSCNVVDKTLHE